MYLFTLIFIIQRFHYHLSDREQMSQPIIVKQMKYANSVPVPAEVEKLNQKFHPTSNEKAFNKGELCVMLEIAQLYSQSIRRV